MFVQNLQPLITEQDYQNLFGNITEIVEINRTLKLKLDETAGQGIEESANAILQCVR